MAEDVTGQSDAHEAESSTAPADPLANLTPEQDRAWRVEGKYPIDVTAESSPAPSGSQSASTDATVAASETATPADRPKKTVKTRSAELDSEIAALNRKLETVRTLREELARTPAKADAPPAESSPAKPTTAEWDRYAKHPDFPKEDDFERYADFVAATSVFIADQRFEERAQRAKEDTASQERLSGLQRTIADAHTRIQEARTADPEFDSKIAPELLQITPAFALGPGAVIGPHHVAAEALVRSTVQAPLLLHFSTPEGETEWQALMKAPTPADLMRQFGRIEARFEKRAEATGKAPVKTVTTAPDPPTTLGRRPADTADDVQSAFVAGDYSRWKSLENARAVAARR